MTAIELSANIGKGATLIVTLGKDSLRIPVTVTDCRLVFGRVDYQVNFCNQLAWASENQVKILKGE